MKNFIPLLSLLMILGFTQEKQAQHTAGIGFELGARVAVGPSALWEPGITDSDMHDYNINIGYSYGLSFSVNFDRWNNLILETMIGNGTQKFDLKERLGAQVGVNTLEWQTTDLYLLYRRENRGGYFEVGPKLSIMNSVDQSVTNNPGFQSEFFEGNLEDFYASSYASAVFGFGGYFAGSRSFSVGLGLRFEYALTNFTSDRGTSTGFGYPFPYDSSYDVGNLRNINVYGTVELRIPIGRVAKVRCGERGFIFGG